MSHAVSAFFPTSPELRAKDLPPVIFPGGFFVFLAGETH